MATEEERQANDDNYAEQFSLHDFPPFRLKRIWTPFPIIESEMLPSQIAQMNKKNRTTNKLGSPAVSKQKKRIRPVTFRPYLTAGLVLSKSYYLEHFYNL